MSPLWLLRAARWARNPPSSARVKLVLGVIAACLVLAAIEHFWGWPDSLTVSKTNPRGGLR
jgi:hypothetical protein